MINILKKILEEMDCSILENDNEIRIYDNKAEYPEDYIRVKKIDNMYVVEEIHRDTKNIIFSTNNVEKACIFAAVICKKLFDEDINREDAHIIRKYVDEGNEKFVIDFLIDKGLENYFSINCEVYDKISFLKNGGLADIKYAGKCIAKDVSLSRGYVILNNYSEKLKTIYFFYKNDLEMYKQNIDFYEISKLYIYGKI